MHGLDNYKPLVSLFILLSPLSLLPRGLLPAQTIKKKKKNRLLRFIGRRSAVGKSFFLLFFLCLSLPSEARSLAPRLFVFTMINFFGNPVWPLYMLFTCNHLQILNSYYISTLFLLFGNISCSQHVLLSTFKHLLSIQGFKLSRVFSINFKC